MYPIQSTPGFSAHRHLTAGSAPRRAESYWHSPAWTRAVAFYLAERQEATHPGHPDHPRICNDCGGTGCRSCNGQGWEHPLLHHHECRAESGSRCSCEELNERDWDDYRGALEHADEQAWIGGDPLRRSAL